MISVIGIAKKKQIYYIYVKKIGAVEEDIMAYMTEQDQLTA